MVTSTIIIRNNQSLRSVYVVDGSYIWIDCITDVLPVVIKDIDYYESLEIRWFRDQTKIVGKFRDSVGFVFHEYTTVGIDDLDDMVSLITRRELFRG